MAGSMFREKSLERLTTPDRLDGLLTVVRPRGWLPLLALAAVVLAAAAWSVFGRIPVTARGVAVLVHPRQVVSFQSPAAGHLISLDVRVGDRVEPGQVMGRLSLPGLSKELQEEEAKLAAHRARQKEWSEFEEASSREEKEHVASERQLIEGRILALRKMAEEIREKSRAHAEQQRKKIATARRLSEDLKAAQQARLESQLRLKAEGLSTDEELVAARAELNETELRLAELDVKLQELSLSEIQVEETWLSRQDLVADLSLELQKLSEREAGIDRRLLKARLDAAALRREIESTIARLRDRLENEGRIVSEHRGRILEISAQVGAIVGEGQRIGALQVEDPSSRLAALGYFEVRDGKKLSAGLPVRITPGTVSRERYGSILGNVAAVSGYPVTGEAVANQVGNRELAFALTGGGSRIEVLAELAEDPRTPTGYRWTSAAGPDVEITAGTTAEIRVTIEERAPITFILPILRSWF